MPSKNEIIPYQQKASFRAPSDLLLNQLPWGGSSKMWGGKMHEKAISRWISEKISRWLDQNGTKKKAIKRKVWVACNLYCVLLPYFCLSGWKAVIFWLIRWTEHFPRIAHLWIHPGVLQRLDCGWPHHRHICRHVVSHPIWHEGRHLENVGNKRSTPHFLVKKNWHFSSSKEV